MKPIRTLIREQMQAQVQEKIRQIVMDSLNCFAGSVETKAGKMYIHNMYLSLRDIKFEPGELHIALRYEEGTFTKEHDQYPNHLSLMNGSLAFRYWFKERFRTLKYYNVHQIQIQIVGGGKTLVLHIPPLKPTFS